MKNKDQLKQAQMREQKRRYRQTHKTFTLSYTLAEARTLYTHAKSKGWKSVPAYFKALAKADMQNIGFVLPPDKQFTEMIYAINSIGGNINQLTRHIHSSKQISKQDIVRLQQLLKHIEQSITQTIKQPPSIESYLAEFLTKHPHKRQALLMFLSRYGH